MDQGVRSPSLSSGRDAFPSFCAHALFRFVLDHRYSTAIACTVVSTGLFFLGGYLHKREEANRARLGLDDSDDGFGTGQVMSTVDAEIDEKNRKAGEWSLPPCFFSFEALCDVEQALTFLSRFFASSAPARRLP